MLHDTSSGLTVSPDCIVCMYLYYVISGDTHNVHCILSIVRSKGADEGHRFETGY